MHLLYEIGIEIIQYLQTWSPALDGLMKAISSVGRLEIYLLLAAGLYWLVSPSLGLRALLLLLATEFFVTGLKQILREPRPYWIGDVKALAEETSYGIPSGHAADSLSIWGYLGSRLKQRWIWELGSLVVLLTAVSRMYLGVHFPTDVLGGWLVALVTIYLFTRSERIVVPWWRNQTTLSQVGIGFGLSFSMILVGIAIRLLLASTPDPAEWAEYSTLARSTHHYFGVAGALFGTLAGHAFMRRFAAFQVRGTEGRQLLRYLVGCAGGYLFYWGLSIVFGSLPFGGNLFAFGSRYARYAVLTFWGTFGAPWIFLKLNLAEPEAESEAGMTSFIHLR